MTEAREEQGRDLIFALDIGTRSIIGMVGRTEGERVQILAVEKQEHSKRAMIDGQIEDIEQVGRVAAEVTARLENRLNCKLTRVCIAAAGRALHTQTGHFQLELPEVRRIGEDLIGQLEAGAVSEAEAALEQGGARLGRYYLVGYTVSQYQLDGYPLTTLRGHNGQKLEADVVATFLPAEVVDSLYAAMKAAGLEVVSLTLEPIAAINAAIPPDLRLLNLVMADIGAGTSDIAACRDGSVVGYTMATVAGDEITEAVMRAYLVDFPTAERLKAELAEQETLRFTDILGLEQELPAAELQAAIQPAVRQLADELARRIREVNGGAPSAVFLAGGGSKLTGLLPSVAAALEMDPRRVAIAGGNFKASAFSNDADLNDPEYATPLGIAVSAGLGLISDSYRVRLNGQPAKLFRSGVLTALDVLQMNGYTYADLIGRTGASLAVTIDGRRTLFRGEPAAPSVLRINGKELPPSTVIQAADEIEFTPAASGKPGRRTLAEALGGEQAAARCLVNGMPAGPDYELRSGDAVETNVIVPVSAPEEAPAPAQAAAIPAPAAPVNAAPASAVVWKAPAVSAALAAPAAPAMPAAPVMNTVPASPVPAAYAPAASAAPASAAPAAPVAPAAPALPRRRFVLNGETLLLSAKPGNAPYYLMDLLDRTGLDFDRLDRPVILQVNGENSAFMRILKDDDDILIREEDTPHA